MENVNPRSDQPDNSRDPSVSPLPMAPSMAPSVDVGGSKDLDETPQPWAPGFAPAQFPEADQDRTAQAIEARTGLPATVSPPMDSANEGDHRIIQVWPYDPTATARGMAASANTPAMPDEEDE